MKDDKSFYKNLIIATILSTLLITMWNGLTKNPEENQETKIIEQEENQIILQPEITEETQTTKQKEIVPINSKPKIEQQADSIKINTRKLQGEISLRGLTFNKLILQTYYQDLKKIEKIVLLDEQENGNSYIVDFGWISQDKNIETPTSNTIWNSKNKELTATTPAILDWTNNQGLKFQIILSIDENYMFNIQQSVTNSTGKSVVLIPYGRISKTIKELEKAIFILHEGAIGVFDNQLEEITYKNLAKKDYKFENNTNWFGITDKYWLTAIIPDKNHSFITKFSYKNNKYKTEFIGKNITIYNDQTINLNNYFFAGAKELNILDKYSKDLNIPLFDRAVDFGWYYFLTKPIYILLKLFYNLIGNFGVAILILTLIVKILTYPLSKKSFVSMAKMKTVQPKVSALKKEYPNDKSKLNKEIMKLYQKEKVNPMSGCLPMFIQIPIFFSLYKVLYVTLDMRHAPFFAFIKDLSAPDPTNILNLFGLLSFETSASFHIGLLPILMSVTIYLQQKLNTQVTDNETAKAMTKYMPIIFLFLFINFPAGLLIYWIFSNIITIVQQFLINKKIK